jgi:hypothetical protein
MSSSAFTKLKQYRSLNGRMIAITPRRVEQCAQDRNANNNTAHQHHTALSRSTFSSVEQNASQEAMDI